MGISDRVKIEIVVNEIGKVVYAKIL